MSVRQAVRRFAARLFRSKRAQRFLDRMASRVDFWRGYGSGAYIDSSGEKVLFEVLRGQKSGARDPVVFDIGANVGAFSAAAFDALGPTISVHAFEPAQEVFKMLSARFAANERVVLNNVAVGRNPGDQALFAVGGDSGMASLLPRKFIDAKPAVFQETVGVVRLTDYCASRDIQFIDLLKIDVEGFELDVLSGAEPLFQQGKIAMCSFEFGGCNIDSRTFLRDFFIFFQAHNMELLRITPGGTLIRLPRYAEHLERFTTTNYVAVRGKVESSA